MEKEHQSYYQKYLTVALSILIVLTVILLVRLSSQKTIQDPVFQVGYASEKTVDKNSTQVSSEEKPSSSSKPGKVKNTEDDPMEKENLLVDLNVATKEELMELPGVGPKMAEAMIRYREENKGFSSEKDLMNVSGIGEKRYKRMEPFIKKISGSSSGGHATVEDYKPQTDQKNKTGKTLQSEIISDSCIICVKCGRKISVHKAREYHASPYCPFCLSYLFEKQPVDQ